MDMSNIDPHTLLKNSKPEVCSVCDGNFFKQTFMFRRVSKFFVGAPQDQLVPIPVFRCDDCGNPIGDMVPDTNDIPATDIDPNDPENDTQIIKMN